MFNIIKEKYYLNVNPHVLDVSNDIRQLFLNQNFNLIHLL